ncbi:MAG: hypothetical protein H0V88_08940 [Pyrinomonadaceae bacterium]|nr:hypothetical protein [Pyrinomonadaceae bacterium]
MGAKGKETTQKLMAIVVIITMMMTMGIPPAVIVFFTVVVYLVYRAVQHSEHQQISGIFRFYIASNEILRDEERRWYGYEIARVIRHGENILHSMNDAPPLVLYALAALHGRAGDDEQACKLLARLVENEETDESRRFDPSAELLRYVSALRQLEREPAQEPQAMAAIRSLERARRTRAAAMLAEVRGRLRTQEEKLFPQASLRANETARFGVASNNLTAKESVTTNTPGEMAHRPPIADVLRDVYEEKKSA